MDQKLQDWFWVISMSLLWHGCVKYMVDGTLFINKTCSCFVCCQWSYGPWAALEQKLRQPLHNDVWFICVSIVCHFMSFIQWVIISLTTITCRHDCLTAHQFCCYIGPLSRCVPPCVLLKGINSPPHQSIVFLIN